MMLFSIIEVMTSLVENFWGIYIPIKVAGKKDVTKWQVCIGVSVLTLCVELMNQYVLFSIWISVIGIILMSLVAAYLSKANIFDVAAIIVCYILLIYILDFSILSLLGTICNKSDLASTIVEHYSAYRVVFLVLTKVSLSLLCYMFLKFYHMFKIEQISKWSYLISGAVVIYYFVNRTLRQSDIDTFISWMLFLAFIILGVYTILQHSKRRMEEEHLLFEEERYYMLVKNYKNFIENYHSSQTFNHDLKNQYLILKNYLEHKEYEKAEAYMNKLVLSPTIGILETVTGIESLDILLAYKTENAERLGIRVSIIAETVNLKLTDSELVSLFGNLLDNAIEACKDMESGKRWIQIAIRNIRNMVFIKVENPYLKKPNEENGTLKTTKADKNIHGFGLKSINDVVKKYNGVSEFEYGEGIFSNVISFFD